MAVTFQVGSKALEEMVTHLKASLVRVMGSTETTALGEDVSIDIFTPIEIATTSSNSKFESNNSVEAGNALIIPMRRVFGMREIVLGVLDGIDYKVYGKAIINKSNPNNDDVVLINKIEVNITGG